MHHENIDFGHRRFGEVGGIAQYNRDFLGAIAELPRITAVDILPRLAPEPTGVLPKRIRQHRAAINRLAYSVRALGLCIRTKPDIIFSGHIYHSPLAQKLCSLTGAKLISQVHGIEVWQPLVNSKLKPLLKPDLVVCVSRDTDRRYQEQVSLSVKNSLVLNNTVQPYFYPRNRLNARRSFGLKDKFALLSVSKLDSADEYKGHDKVIRALSNSSCDNKLCI